MKNLWVENVLMMFGKPSSAMKPEDYSPGALAIHDEKRANRSYYNQKRIELKEKHSQSHKWKIRRWSFLIFVNLLFVASYRFDVQILEGALTGSRLIGFHLIDLNSALQVMLAHKHIIINLLIGTATIGAFWLLMGGRTFCSWVCPYHFLSEWAEKLHLYLFLKKGIARNIKFSRKTRTFIYILFAALAYFSGYTVYETISPTGIVSRALIYGPGVGLVWIALLLLFEIFFSRRAWCRYLCPVGLTYGIVGSVSPVRVTYDLRKCFHEGDCRKVCLVPHALDVVLMRRAPREKVAIGPDCTRCGMCIDVCPSGALQFEVKGLKKLIE